MNLVWFLTIGGLFSLILGEFSRFPFGGGEGLAMSISDIFLGLILVFNLVWQIGIKKSISLPAIYKILALFILVGFLSLIASLNLGGIFYLLRFILYSSLIWVGFCLVKDTKIRIEYLLKITIFLGLLLSILGFFQLLIYPDLEPLTVFGFDPHKGRLVSTFLDPNFIGLFLNFPLIFSFYFWKTKKVFKYLLFFLVILLAIFLTYSRSAYLMSGVVLFLMGIFKEKKLIVALLIVGLLAYFYIPRFSTRINGVLSLDKTASERLESWGRGKNVFIKNPILGVGFNNLRSYMEKENLFRPFQKNGGHAGAGVDSSFLFVMATTGIVGFLVFILFWIKLFKDLLGKPQKQLTLYLVILFLGVLLSSQFINALFYPSVMFLSFLLIGAWYADSD